MLKELEDLYQLENELQEKLKDHHIPTKIKIGYQKKNS